MRFYFFLLVYFSATIQAAEKSRPMNEMHGDCSAYATNLAAEFKLWEQQPTILTHGKPEKISLEKKNGLKLEKQNKINYLATPEKSFTAETKKYGGLFYFKTDSQGYYRISAGGKFWFDLVPVGLKTVVDAVSFEMQTKCSSIFKTVEFKLDGYKEYAIQVSSSSEGQVDMLVSRVGESKPSAR